MRTGIETLSTDLGSRRRSSVSSETSTTAEAASSRALASPKIEAEVSRSAFSAALDTAARLPGRVRADAPGLEDDGEPALERAGEHLAHRALLEALDQRFQEALDDQALGLGRREPAGLEVEDLLGI